MPPKVSFKTGFTKAFLVMFMGLLAAALGLFDSRLIAEFDPSGKVIREVQVIGNIKTKESMIRNQIRSLAGSPYNKVRIREDIARLTHLGRFSRITPLVTLNQDDSVTVTWDLLEEMILRDVMVVGNKKLTDAELIGYLSFKRTNSTGVSNALKKVLPDTWFQRRYEENWNDGFLRLKPGDPIDPFLIDKGRKSILDAYKEKGFYRAQVTYNKDLLKTQNILMLHVREGPKIKVRAVVFEGNKQFDDKLLKKDLSINGDRYVFFKGSSLNPDKVTQDLAKLRQFYMDRGYLDAAIGRLIQTSDNQKNAVIRYIIEEGPKYTVKDIVFKGNNAFSNAQLKQAMSLHTGSTYTAQLLRKSKTELDDLYGKLGLIDTQVRINRVFIKNQPLVNVTVEIDESKPSYAGQVTIKGNRRTQDRTVLREIRGIKPGRKIDGAGLRKTEQRLRESPLFEDATVTVLGKPTDPNRDILIEVEEGKTTRFSIGASLSSDTGLFGNVSYEQKNFDIMDMPQSFSEFFGNQSLTGAGQTFRVDLQPGLDQSRYSVAFFEPHLLESPINFSVSGFIFERDREDWQEGRTGAEVSVGHRFGDVWSVSSTARAQEVRINDLSASAPLDAFAAEGSNNIQAIGIGFARNNTDSRLFPTTGSNGSINFEVVSDFGGDYRFNTISGEYKRFWAIDEDFLTRKTVLSWGVKSAYMFGGDVPLFERLYAGGHSSMRGFEFRGVGPRGIQANTLTRGDDAVGGIFSFSTSVEYNFPLYEKIIRGVFFIDAGTVDTTTSLSRFRVAAGAGIRLALPQLGPTPLALDFAIPLAKETGDQTQVFSFSAALPF